MSLVSLAVILALQLRVLPSRGCCGHTDLAVSLGHVVTLLHVGDVVLRSVVAQHGSNLSWTSIKCSELADWGKFDFQSLVNEFLECWL